jgi:sulfite exporter TauE/SafE
MFLFGLGTLPVLLAAGLFTTFLSLKLRLAGERLAAAAVLFMGIFMVAKWAMHIV